MFSPGWLLWQRATESWFSTYYDCECVWVTHFEAAWYICCVVWWWWRNKHV